MKLKGDKKEVETGGVSNQGTFRINNSAHAFKILSEGLYSNKTRAVIRELSCNAYDSHVVAGKKEVPFDVHLPNEIEPFFSVKDYGIGLSHDEVINLYTTYFESTKQNSNDVIGALGLGSKSPFAISDKFTVTAIKDGSKRIYGAYLDEKGVPSIAMMSDSQTTEPNGVEVKVPVDKKKTNFGAWVQEALYVYLFFTPYPNIVNNTHYKPVAPEWDFEDLIPGVSIYKNRSDMDRLFDMQGGYGASPAFALQGNVLYPLELSNSEQDDDIDPDELKGWKKFEYDILRKNIIVRFDIGELSVTPSREKLSLDQHTVKNIRKKLKEIRKGISVYIEGKMNEAKCDFDRLLQTRDMLGDTLLDDFVRVYMADDEEGSITKRYEERDVQIRDNQLHRLFMDTEFYDKLGVKQICLHSALSNKNPDGSRTLRLTKAPETQVISRRSFPQLDANGHKLKDTDGKTLPDIVHEYMEYPVPSDNDEDGYSHSRLFFVFNDSDFTAAEINRRLRYFFRNEKQKTIMVYLFEKQFFDNDGDPTSAPAKTSSALDKNTIAFLKKEMKDRLGFGDTRSNLFQDVTTLGEIPKEEKVKLIAASKEKGPCVYRFRNRQHRRGDGWDEVSPTSDSFCDAKTIHYVPLSNKTVTFEYEGEERTIKTSDLEGFLDAIFVTLVPKVEKVYGLRQAAVEAVKEGAEEIEGYSLKDKKFVNIMDQVIAGLDGLTQDELDSMYILHHADEQLPFGKKFKAFVRKNAILLQNFKDDSKFKLAFDGYETLYAKASKGGKYVTGEGGMNYWERIFQYMGNTELELPWNSWGTRQVKDKDRMSKISDAANEWNGYKDEFFKLYPMLQIIDKGTNYSYNEPDPRVIFEYIQLIDRKENS